MDNGKPGHFEVKLKYAAVVFVAIVLIAFSTLSVLLIKTTNMLEEEAVALSRASDRISVARELRSHLLLHNRNAFLFSLGAMPGRFRNQQKEKEELLMLMEQTRDLTRNSRERHAYARVETGINLYLAERERLDSLKMPSVFKYQLISDEVEGAVAAIDRLADLSRVERDALIQAISNQNSSADRLALRLLIIMGLLLLGVGVVVIYHVVRPLLQIAASMKAYSRGERQKRAEMRGFSEIRELSATFNSMADSLEEKRQDLLRFIASIAHDIRNPLNAMALASELLSRTTEGESARLGDIILRQVKNLDRLVTDLLDTTRIEAGQLELRRRTSNISELVREAVEFHSTGGFHKFILELEDGELPCLCDRERISQVVNNLLSNAVKYSPSGGTIRLKAWAGADAVFISVSDQGVGIEPDDMENIFKPFQRSKSTKGFFPGIGLGLSSSRRIVEAHGGRLYAVSEKGKGSTFFVELPFAGSAAPGEQ